jgi:hypothetical protein
MGDNVPGFDAYAVPTKMMRNRWPSYAVIRFLVRCNGYHFGLFGARQERHRVGYRARGIVAAVPANKHSFKLDSTFPETGNNQDWATRPQQSGLDHDVFGADAFRVRLRKDGQIEPSRRACKEFREADR